MINTAMKLRQALRMPVQVHKMRFDTCMQASITVGDLPQFRACAHSSKPMPSLLLPGSVKYRALRQLHRVPALEASRSRRRRRTRFADAALASWRARAPKNSSRRYQQLMASLSGNALS